VAPPGDLMSTDIWGGAGMGRAPQEFLHRFPVIGDSVYTRTEVIGLQANSVKPGRAPTGLAAQRMITIDQADRLVLDFCRCAMLPASPD
jgi:acyl dehydratase